MQTDVIGVECETLLTIDPISVIVLPQVTKGTQLCYASNVSIHQ